MATSVTFQLRDQFTATGGTSFSGRTTLTIDTDDFPGTLFASQEVSAIMHYTAPVGSSYEQVVDLRGAIGSDNFGDVSQYVYILFINRSTTQACTIRTDSTGSDAFFQIPAGKWLTLPFPELIFGDSASTQTISAKFASSSDTLEVLAFSINAAFS